MRKESMAQHVRAPAASLLKTKSSMHGRPHVQLMGKDPILLILLNL